MDDLNSFREKLEANLSTLNKFEGLENDLIQQHGNLRAQFSEYREAIEAANLTEKEKREHYGYHDELVKKLHKLILEAKALARKRTEQMTRDELFKLSQERQKSLKPQSAEDKIGEEVTKSLKRMLETMRTEVERSSSNISTARETTKNLQGTTENYEKLSGTLEESRSLIRDLWKKNRNDMIYIIGALGVFVATAVYVILQRTPGIVWLPGKLVLRQLGILVPKSSERAGKFVERVVEMTEAVLSDSEVAPDMFVDRILNREEYGNDDLLKQEDENKTEQPVFKERSESERTSGEETKLKEEQVLPETKVEEPETTSPVADVVETVAVESVEGLQTQASEVNQNISETRNNSEAPSEVPKEIVAEEEIKKKNVAEESIEIIEKEKQAVPETVERIQNVDVNVSPIAESTETQGSNEDSTTDEAVPLTTATESIASTIASVDIIESPAITIPSEESVIIEEPNNSVETPIKFEEPLNAEESTVQTESPVPEQIVEALETEAGVTATINPTITETQKPLEATTATQDSLKTPAPTSAKIMTESAYYTASDSEFEGNHGIYSSETELFSGNEEKMEL